MISASCGLVFVVFSCNVVDCFDHTMEDLTQNPAVMDTLSNMVQSVDGPRRGQGGFDLCRMM